MLSNEINHERLTLNKNAVGIEGSCILRAIPWSLTRKIIELSYAPIFLSALIHSNIFFILHFDEFSWALLDTSVIVAVIAHIVTFFIKN